MVGPVSSHQRVNYRRTTVLTRKRSEEITCSVIQTVTKNLVLMSTRLY